MHIHNKKIFFKRFLEVTLTFLSGFFWILALFGFDEPTVALITLISAAIHELGHEAALLILGKPPRLPAPKIIGLKIRTRTPLSYKEEIAVLGAGPLANVFAALIALVFFSRTDWQSLFSAVNAITAIANLVPVRSYDGYKIIYAAAAHFECEWLRVALEVSSLLFASVVLFLSLYSIDRLDAGYWIFGVFFIFLLGEIKISFGE